MRRGTQFQASKTHCAQGHAFDDANTVTYIRNGSKRRQCRICLNQRQREYKKRKNASGAERSCGSPGCGKPIAPGDKYLSWSFRFGGTHFRCTAHPPRPSELTQSLMANVYSAIESAQDDLPTTVEVADIVSLVEEVAGVTAEVAEQYRDAAEPFGGQGENAERADELESWQSELENFSPDEPDEDTTDTDAADLREAARAEAEELLGGCPL